MTNRMIGVGILTLIFAGVAFAGPERVEFPKDSKTSCTLVATRDGHRGGNGIVDVYVNQVALKGGKQAELPSDSYVMMETWSAKLDAQQQPMLDANGRMIKDQLRGLVAMEKRAGWGKAYPADLRNGDWEYASFSLDDVRREGSTQSCFECHGAVKELDYVFVKPDIEELAK